MKRGKGELMETCREGGSPGDTHEASSVLLFFVVTIHSAPFYPELGVSRSLREWPCGEPADHSAPDKVHSIWSDFLYLRDTGWGGKARPPEAPLRGFL